MVTPLAQANARSKSMVMGEVSRGSGPSPSPGLQEGVLKAGWLKKQRSIMKNWQLRWFVLRSDYLYFYKDEEETKPQLEHPHTVPADGAVGVEVEEHQVFWTVLTKVPPHTNSLGVSTKTKAGLVTEDDPLPF
ncbi:hypothetical protein NFI96_001754 [Prochilodus magdalenae]|nr:hypothetical protein NFI96_001754 [Prochilodus magdalenae]